MHKTVCERPLTLTGQGNGRGSAAGKTKYLAPKPVFAFSPAGEPKRELFRLEEAMKVSLEELRAIYRELSAELGERASFPFLLEAELLSSDFTVLCARAFIEAGKSAEDALSLTLEYFLSRESHKGFLAEVQGEMRDLISRLSDNLRGHEKESSDDGEDYILLSRYPLPSDIYFHRTHLLGVLADVSWQDSSAERLVRALGIPAVFTRSDITEEISGRNAIIDSARGALYIEPSLETVERYTEHKGTPRQITDRDELTLYLEPDDIFSALREASTVCDGIGLVGSECLYLRELAPPDEETLFEVYRALGETFRDKKVNIRAFKCSLGTRISKLRSEGDSQESVYVKHDETLKRQLRAVMRAAVYGRLSLAARGDAALASLATECAEELSREQREFSKIELGVIIDTPAAAICADNLIPLGDYTVVKHKDILPFEKEEPSELELDALSTLLKSIAKSARASAKPIILSFESVPTEDNISLAKQLGFSAISIPKE